MKPTLAQHAATKVAALIDRVAAESLRAREEASEDGIHNLRVAIRRLTETLRVFEDVLPEGAATRVRKELRMAMRLAGEIRNHDIALELAAKAEVKVNDSFRRDRSAAVENLKELLAVWSGTGVFHAWSAQLHA